MYVEPPWVRCEGGRTQADDQQNPGRSCGALSPICTYIDIDLDICIYDAYIYVWEGGIHIYVYIYVYVEYPLVLWMSGRTQADDQKYSGRSGRALRVPCEPQ